MRLMESARKFLTQSVGDSKQNYSQSRQGLLAKILFTN